MTLIVAAWLHQPGFSRVLAAARLLSYARGENFPRRHFARLRQKSNGVERRRLISHQQE
jgi:hypothetical protein